MKGSKRLIPIAVLVVVGAVAILVLVSRGNDRLLGASGTVEATEARLGFQAPGRIETIGPREGDRVTAGDELAALDREETLARRAQAAARVEAVRATLQELERGFRSEEVAQGRAELQEADRRLEDARRDVERTRRLFDGGAVSQEALDKVLLALDVAESGYEQAKERVRILETGPRAERIEAQRAQLAEAEAAVRTIDATLENMTIRAPFDGIVTVRHAEPGEVLPAGTPVLTLMRPDDRWVRIYVPETRVGAVSLGQPAEIRIDTFPDRSFEGEVVYIASEAEFTPKNVQTDEERVKLVYAVKVRVTGDSQLRLKPGLPADVYLEAPSGE
jgi:HlyD family secretion protein